MKSVRIYIYVWLHHLSLCKFHTMGVKFDGCFDLMWAPMGVSGLSDK